VVVPDRRFGDLVELPAGIAEIGIAGAPRVSRVPDAEIVVECAPLLLVDGVEHQMTVTLDAGAATTGRAARATSCDGPTELAAGEHVISAAPFSPVTVDRLVLDSGADAALATGDTDLRPTVQVLRGGRFDRQVEVTDCPDGCWLVVGEGYSTGWSASADGADLGEPVPVDGGSNGWWLTGRDAPTVVEVTWTPQRTLVWALWLSLAGVVAALAVAALTRRAGLPLTVVPRPRWTWSTPTSTVVVAPQTPRRVLGVAFDAAAFETRSMVLVLTWAGLSALLIQPEWAVWGTLAGFGAALWQRPRLPELTALASVVVVAVLVVVRERRNAPVAGGGWPGVFEDWHGLAVFAVVSLLVGALTTDDAAWRRAPGGERNG
jgi:arabinofuranan 3-O-arabinosyltransferase